jgi:hypothetical protein
MNFYEVSISAPHASCLSSVALFSSSFILSLAFISHVAFQTKHDGKAYFANVKSTVEQSKYIPHPPQLLGHSRVLFFMAGKQHESVCKNRQICSS